MKKSHCFLGIAALLISIAANAFPQTAYAEDNLTVFAFWRFEKDG